MKQTARIISTYTGDTSGVCSALFELGGLVIMHDASGCNSTYNTHDEPRWYDTDSLVFISALTEIDAITGNDRHLIDDVVAAAKLHTPAFIAIASTPIPALCGFDEQAVALSIERETGIPTFGFPTDGMHDYTRGVSMALAAVAGRCISAPIVRDSTLSVNLLGATPLDFSVNGTVESMKAFFEGNGIPVRAVLAMGSHFRAIRTCSRACVNVVVSSCGMEAARVMEERFGIPYVIGCPHKATEKALLSAVRRAHETGVSGTGLSSHAEDAPTVIIGEAVTALSLADALLAVCGIRTQVIAPVGTPLLPREGQALCLSYNDECDIEAAVKGKACVIADPMYRPICDVGTCFIPLPHEACSGRIYRRDIPDLTFDLSSLTNQLPL